MADTPLLITALSIWAYWLCVLVMAAQRHLARRSAAVLLPADRREQVMWLLWLPTIVAWNALPALAGKDHLLLALPHWAEAQPIVLAVRWAACIVAAAAFLATVSCWAAMGRNWAVGVVARTQQELVTTGPFAIVRHPIYALSVLLIICTLITLPTIALAVVAAVHIALLNIKARSEEQHLLREHGEAYAAYMQRTGRFVPRLFG